MSVRKVSHIGKNIIGRFPSLKMGRMVSFESTIERDYLHLLEFDAGVTGFNEQPLTIEYTAGLKVRHYTPDFRVQTVAGTILVECKPQSQVDHPKNQTKFKAATSWCEQQHWAFQVVTEQEIRKGHYLSNVKLLFWQARRQVPVDTFQRASRILKVQPCTLHDLATQLAPDQTAVVKADLLCLAFHHQIKMDLMAAPITGRSLLYPDGGKR